eukprot:CAMPEP_0113641458 /NCGR_PEP_ID=MMETSP0017_2-20120614/21763_1 /TAXON_ID=2856 /ORGANISM="Cylindrotheca closterium" /LENGTH=277 /DNA_ID=CAMNT_0000552799 /DNA_START=527 /DNA_END=1360 /DNA_ORIENTATION=- /assembly_acc=CAM_ASM_000147
MVSQNSKPIEIGVKSFAGCSALANLVLPQASSAVEDSFEKCTLLERRFANGAHGIVAGLVGRFDGFPVHMLCYFQTSTTDEELRLCIENHEVVEESLVDTFGMTPHHVLFSAAETCRELLQVLFDKFPHYVLGWKDVNGKLAMEYLVSNWNPRNKTLLQMALQCWMLSRLESWGATSSMVAMQSKVQATLAEDDKERRSTLWAEAKTEFAKYEIVEATSILEMALWKEKLKSGWSNNGAKRQPLDRGECRCVCGSDVVIPNVVQFLGIVGSNPTRHY